MNQPKPIADKLQDGLSNQSSESLSSPEGLQHAFLAFNQLSEQLASSYQALQEQVAELSAELQATQSARIQELTEKERLAQRLESLINGLPAGVIVLDGNGCIQKYNLASLKLLGEPLENQLWSEVIKRSFSPRDDDRHDISLVNGRRVTISTCPLESEPGQILLLTDVTDMRALQDKVNHHQRLASMGEMAASLAHQIRTPLSSALLYASHLKRNKIDSEDRQRFSERIAERLRYLESLVNDMLLFARGEKIETHPVMVTELLLDLEQQITPKLVATGISLEIENDCKQALLMANHKLLISALMNLVDNAIQALNNEGTIEVRASCDTEQVFIVISDNGPGIAWEKQAEIFNPFFTTRNEGTGLGLAVVKAIIHSHKGSIVVDSKAGKGTSFVINLQQYYAEEPRENIDMMRQVQGSRS